MCIEVGKMLRQIDSAELLADREGVAAAEKQGQDI
jgi:hypothetical protein